MTPFSLPKRQDFGTLGRPIHVKTNFFPITYAPLGDIHHYLVTITPESSARTYRLIFKRWEQLLLSKGLIAEDCLPVFDGKSNLFVREPFVEGVEGTGLALELHDETVGDGSRSSQGPVGNPRKFNLTLRKLKTIDMSTIESFLQGNPNPNEPVDSAFLALDILLRHRSSSHFIPMGKNFFSEKSASSLSGGVELWKGFHQSLKPCVRGMLLNIDIASGAFYDSGPVLNSVAKLLGYTSPYEIQRALSQGEHNQVKRFLNKLQIVSDYRGGKKRKWKVTGLTENPAFLTLFPMQVEDRVVQTSVTDYFYNQYQIKLEFDQLPCLIVGDPSKHIYMPLEVCRILPGQRYTHKLDECQTKEMIRLTCLPPQARFSIIQRGYSSLIHPDDPYLKSFKVSVEPEMLTIPARVLSPPTITYSPQSKFASLVPRDGTWNVNNQILVQPCTLNSWCVLVFCNSADLNIGFVEKFCQYLVSACFDAGITVNHRFPPIRYISVNLPVLKAFRMAEHHLKESTGQKPQLIMCVIPPSHLSLYAEIKRVSETVVGIPSQCVQSKKIFTSKHTSSLALKINVKLGGSNYILPQYQLPFVSEIPTIVFGADVTHPPYGDTSKPSIAAVVASMDIACSRYASCTRVQPPRQEVMCGLKDMVKELISKFTRERGCRPERILYYRDGVGQGQFREIVEKEVASVKEACLEIQDAYQPTITFVLVQKRHRVRLFPINKHDCDRSGNIQPGTVVDSEVTHPFEFDFYLVSHAGVQGTSRPTHYHVLFDENQLTANALQDLTYKLCYLYCRATRSVSLVPPAYYAHLVASRARFHVAEQEENPDIMKMYAQVHPEIEKVMYFM